MLISLFPKTYDRRLEIKRTLSSLKYTKVMFLTLSTQNWKTRNTAVTLRKSLEIFLKEHVLYSICYILPSCVRFISTWITSSFEQPIKTLFSWWNNNTFNIFVTLIRYRLRLFYYWLIWYDLKTSSTTLTPGKRMQTSYVDGSFSC